MTEYKIMIRVETEAEYNKDFNEATIANLLEQSSIFSYPKGKIKKIEIWKKT